MSGHYGKIFFRLAAHYPDLSSVILEYVQNAIDFGATTIQVVIDRKRHGLAIRNNGPTATLEGFNEALMNVGNSEKDKTPGKYGRFGIGLISALGKCDSFTFTTHSGKEALRWSFNCGKIADMREVEIPLATITQEALLAKDSMTHHVVRWSSELLVTKYTTDKRKSALDTQELAKRILGGYSIKMRERGIVVWIVDIDEAGRPQKPLAIRAHEFAGRPLEESVLARGVMGETRVRLFVVPKSDKRKGEVLVGTTGNPFRIPFRIFAQQLSKGDLHEEVIEAFNSGIYEGEILHSKISLDANRRRFEEDDHLAQFYSDLWEWYDEHGRQHMEEAADKVREERYQGLGKKLLESLNPFLNGNPLFEQLFNGRSVAGTPLDTSGTINVSEKKQPVMHPRGPNTAPRQPSTPGQPRANPGSPPKNPVENPRGKKQIVAKSKHHGLNISYEENMGFELWQLDLPQHTLRFNSRHPHFAACDRNDRDSLRFQQMVAMSALSLELLTDEERAAGNRLLELQIPLVVDLLTKSSVFTSGFAPKTQTDK